MRSIDLNVEEVIKKAAPHERGMLVAERAAKRTVMHLLSEPDNQAKTKEDARRYLKDKFQDYRGIVKAKLLEGCLPEHPEICMKAELWMTDNLIDAWRDEIIEEYCDRRGFGKRA